MPCLNNIISPLPMDVTGKLSDYEFLSKVITILNDLIKQVGSFDAALKICKEWALQTFLTPSGDLIGSLNGRSVSSVLTLLDSNRDTLLYLCNQFNDGQTGLVIDGGFFEDSGINKNYNGGYFK